MSTMADVAREAGCSLSTVARAMNNKADINPQTRVRILEVAGRLGYAMHGPARSLATGRTRTIGLMIPSPVIPAYATFADAVEQTARECGYNVLLVNTHWDYHLEEQAIRVLREHMVEGIILRPVEVGFAHLREMRDRRLPMVLIQSDIEELGLDFVGSDYAAGSLLGTSHLIELDHRHIAFLGEAPITFSARGRLDGYLQALDRHGIAADERLISVELQGGDIVAAYDIARTLIERNPHCTAVFVGVGFYSVAVLRALRDAGRRIPDDIALVSLGDFHFAPYLEVPLTCVRHPLAEIGAAATKLLVQRIAGERPEEPAKLLFSPDLVIRQSCGAGRVNPMPSAASRR